MITTKNTYNEKISIEKFLVIKKADIEIKKINVIIGPQAQGKSIIAKLAYFFKSIGKIFISSIREKINIRELNSIIKSEFEEKFPRYAWDGTAFSIIYKNGDIEISVIGELNTSGKTSLKIIMPPILTNEFNKKKKEYILNLDKEPIPTDKNYRKTKDEYEIFYDVVYAPLKQGEFGNFFTESTFIPASRSFFANLQKNIFTFLSSNVNIDPYLKEFGSTYETAKSMLNAPFIKKDIASRVEVLKALEAIVEGEYEYKDDKDWIKSKERRINLSNASSGQQESLPMLLVLYTLPFISFRRNGFFFIEEPEAHLFPTSQGHIMSILSTLQNAMGSSFFITTHSPYILTALNNFILAFDTIMENRITLTEFQNINGSGYPINIDDVSAYTVNAGISKNIINTELRLIGADMLDNISEHFECITNRLLAAE